MTHSGSPSTTTGTWPWPPEVPRRPDQPPHPPPQIPTEPQTPSPESPPPILPSWEEPDPHWAEQRLLDLLLDQRVLVVTGHLDRRAADRTAAQLLLLDRTDPSRPIELRISCREAELAAAAALAAAIDLSPPPVHALVSGTLTGPGLAILCAASERTAHRHATFVLALPRTSALGPAAAIATQAEEHDRLVSQLVERIAAASGREGTSVEADLRSGRMLSAEDAVGYGLVDRVV
jgi:ATP-dependent Clp protease, protease subunit